MNVLKLKMKKSILTLVFLVTMVIRSVCSSQKNSFDVDDQRLKLRSAKNSLSWAPSDITVTFKKDFHEILQGRALSDIKTIKNQTLPLAQKKLASQTSSTAIIRKTRTNDSLSRRYSGN